jgi:transposase, IS5 family
MSYKHERKGAFSADTGIQASFAKYGRKSMGELFLDRMNRMDRVKQMVRWAELLALVEPIYAKAGNGRQPVGLAIMPRTYFLQQWFGLSDPGMEEAFYEPAVPQRFAGVDLGAAPAPDETAMLGFRHLLERHDLCGQMLDTVNCYLETKGIRISTGAIVEATIIHAPSSTLDRHAIYFPGFEWWARRDSNSRPTDS